MGKTFNRLVVITTALLASSCAYNGDQISKDIEGEIQKEKRARLAKILEREDVCSPSMCGDKIEVSKLDNNCECPPTDKFERYNQVSAEIQQRLEERGIDICDAKAQLGGCKGPEFDRNFAAARAANKEKIRKCLMRKSSEYKEGINKTVNEALQQAKIMNVWSGIAN